MPKHDPKELEREWREALAAVNGKQLAEASYFRYISGWYYINWAQRFPDGSTGCVSSFNKKGKRERQVIEQIEELRQRAAKGK